MQIQKSVFISYRRTNMPIAQTVRLSLKPQGFDVFFDYDSLDSGDFSQTIINQVGARAHFVLILTPSALERCADPNDWVRKEIEEAIRLQRNIVPLFFEGFDFAKEQHVLKGDYLPLLPNYNGLNIHWDYLDEGMVRLRERFLNKPLELVLHPASFQETERVESAQKITDEKPTPTEKQLKAQEYFEKGMAKARISDYDGAIDAYTQAILLDENFAEAYFYRGDGRWNKGDKEQALNDYEKAAEVDPLHPKINIMQAYIWLEKGELEKALQEAEKGILANPELYEAYFARGLVYHELLDYHKAVEDYSQAIFLNPEYAMAYNNRGIAYYDLRKYRQAIDDYHKMIAVNPNYHNAYNNRGIAYYYLGDYDSAIADFEKALELSPNYEKASDNLKMAQKRKRRKKKE